MPSKPTQAELIKKARKAQQDRNRRFSKLSPAKQRVQIAKDVIEYLKQGKIKAKNRTYMSLDKAIEETMDFMRNFEPTEDIRNMEPKERAEYVADMAKYSELMDTEVCDLIDRSTSCNVCGIGAVFIASVRRADKLKLKDFAPPDSWGDDIDQQMRDYLDEWFDADQRELIERAFEKGEVGGDGDSKNVTQEDDEVAAAFGRKFRNADDRLEAIMRNIVDNDGEFIPG